jgi:hypothetical protein
MYSSFYDKAQSELFCSTFNKQLRILNESWENKKVLSIKEHEYYDVKKELIPGEEIGNGAKDMEMESAYDKNGLYLGEPKTAKLLVDKYGIKQFEKSEKDDSICSIGFNPDNKTWYGWSHRAIVGFKIGDKIFEENFGNDNTKYVEHGKITITNLDQAKQSAINFAKYVS